jgi:hypothetical protein
MNVVRPPALKIDSVFQIKRNHHNQKKSQTYGVFNKGAMVNTYFKIVGLETNCIGAS